MSLPEKKYKNIHACFVCNMPGCWYDAPTQHPHPQLYCCANTVIATPELAASGVCAVSRAVSRLVRTATRNSRAQRLAHTHTPTVSMTSSA